jgi:hypothetical protein
LGGGFDVGSTHTVYIRRRVRNLVADREVDRSGGGCGEERET